MSQVILADQVNETMTGEYFKNEYDAGELYQTFKKKCSLSQDCKFGLAIESRHISRPRKKKYMTISVSVKKCIKNLYHIHDKVSTVELERSCLNLMNETYKLWTANI